MWLTLAKVLAYTAAAMIGLRIVRLVTIAFLPPATVNEAEHTIEPRENGAASTDPPRRRRGLDRVLHWGFYACMAAAAAAFFLHTRQS
jgi:hypothetical protein